MNCVVLDRVVADWTPPYCVHGVAVCVGGCGRWVWLGSETERVVSGGGVLPLCRQCACRLAPAGAVASRNLGDHLRADGPHG